MSYVADMARSVVRYDPAYKTELREFQRKYFGPDSRQADDAFFEWLFLRNPHRDPAGPSLWLCRRDGMVVGQQASIPAMLKIGDLQYRGGWVIDWMVHPAWRLKGVAPALFSAYTEATEIALGLGVEEAPYRAFLRSGWTDLGTLSLFVRPLDPQACAKGLNAPKLLTRMAPRALVGGSARVVGRLAAATRRVSLDPIPAFDERVNAVWAAASREHEVLVRRDFEYLRWRYDDGPHQPLYQRYYLTHRGAVLGYAVVRMDPWHDHVVGRVIDYMVERRSLSPLLALVFERMHVQRAVAVFVEHQYPGVEKTLRTLGCLRVRASHRYMMNVRNGATPLKSALAAPANWFLTPGDGDFDHVMIAPDFVPPG